MHNTDFKVTKFIKPTMSSN